MALTIDTAMVLAAGFGTRLRPITLTMPKPLVKVGGRSMLDRALDMLESVRIEKAIVNVHYLGEKIIEFCAQKNSPACIISDERDAILETGGGVVKALPLLGQNPFILLNADTFWIDGPEPALPAMMARFDPDKMDMMLMVCAIDDTTGHSGGTDFLYHKDGTLDRARNAPDGLVYAGAAILSPAVFAGAQAVPHSLNTYFDQAIQKGRLFGHVLTGGHWITVGTPEGLAQAEAKLALLE